MNLIEEFGSYEKAKKHQIERALNGLLHEYDFELVDALLEYRREHGIYEVGDFIMFEGKLYEIKYIYHPEKARITDGFQGRYIHDFPHGIRHATDLEIKAWRRR